MDYEEFKEEVLGRVRDFYGADAGAEIRLLPGYNHTSRDAMLIRFTEEVEEAVPAIYLNSMYQDYQDGTREIGEIVWDIVKIREEAKMPDPAKAFIPVVNDWEQAKEYVFPALISTKENAELLEQLVSTRYLDLSVIYLLRKDAGDAMMNVKITKRLLNQYGISRSSLHKQALMNLEKEKYRFTDIAEVLSRKGCRKEEWETVPEETHLEPGRIYVLTNRSRHMGAAGVLLEDFVRKVAGSGTCFVLPSSIHETLFVPLAEGMDSLDFGQMVKEVNSSKLEVSEILSDHCYIYDGSDGKLRCA